ncbi:hypothetical protein [Bacteroides intestinalis]|uniref:hypothetical protein n=1 Tax=Bacteroides intestinalis TaxID=329854 RepID=UPI000AB180AE|nr:hypothetical protein [Bacteroides intestinalis]
MSNKVPYNLFDKWYKDTRKKLIPVQAFGTPPTDVVSKAASAPALDQNPTCASPVLQATSYKYLRYHAEGTCSL